MFIGVVVKCTYLHLQANVLFMMQDISRVNEKNASALNVIYKYVQNVTLLLWIH